MSSKTAFVCFFPVYPNVTGSSEIISGRFENWPGDKKLFQLSPYKCKIKNINTVRILKNLPIFKILSLPILVFKIFYYLKNTRKISLAIEGASWVFYSLFTAVTLKMLLPKTKLYYFSHSIEFEVRKKFSNFIIYKITFFLEKILFNICDTITSVSVKEKNKIKNLYNIKSIIFPNSINFKNKPKKKNLLKNIYIIYCGSYLYKPNKEAIDYLNKNIMPKMVNKFPNLKLVITGGGYSGSNYNWLENKNIVSKDALYSLIYNSVCMCLPIKFGSGTRVKILESLCLGGIVVSSKVGIEGIKTIGTPPFIYKNQYQLLGILIKIIKNYKNIKKKAIADRKFYLQKYSVKDNTRNFIINYYDKYT
jgi:hypothetical protein